MKIAIHHRIGSFSDRWIAYCQKNQIEYKLVNAYASDIIQQVSDCDVFMWHFFQGDYRDMQLAKGLVLALETGGVRCFPDSCTCWHFDDKVAQKYLLESISAPLVPSYVFYSKSEAVEWAKHTVFPKVFKLKGGAGAANVKLAKTKKEAIKLINQCFGKGFKQYRWREQFQESFNKCKVGRASLREVLRPIKYALKKYPTEFAHFHQNEMGYAYFQDFIPNNVTDYRVKVVDGNCWAFQRSVRDHDFRASGSGELIFDNYRIPEELIFQAQGLAAQLQLQSVAFDFVHDKVADKYLIVEMSYGFGFDEMEMSNGYWDCHRRFHEELFNPFGWMVENLLHE